MEYRLRRHDGAYRWVNARALPTSASPATLSASVGCCIDVTEARLKTEELAHLVEQRTAELRESTAELEDLSYSIIHDFRAPLRAMQSWSQYLAEEHGKHIDPQGHDYLQRLVTSSARMDKLVTDVLAYSAVLRTRLKLEPVDPNKVLRGMLESYPQFTPANADIKVEGVLPSVLGNEAALTQCFSHLLRNAIEFVAPGVFPSICIGADILPPIEDGAGARADPARNRVRLWVKDNGIGIRPEHQAIIFGTFQRLTKKSGGTGIGLAIVRKAAERMGGKVGVESEPGKGSRFWIELPAA
jgi:signal transduction histidine kinase